MMDISYSRSAQKALQRMPANVSRLIVSKVNQYAADPLGLANNVELLKGEF